MPGYQEPRERAGGAAGTGTCPSRRRGPGRDRTSSVWWRCQSVRRKSRAGEPGPQAPQERQAQQRGGGASRWPDPPRQQQRQALAQQHYGQRGEQARDDGCGRKPAASATPRSRGQADGQQARQAQARRHSRPCRSEAARQPAADASMAAEPAMASPSARAAARPGAGCRPPGGLKTAAQFQGVKLNARA